MKQISLRTIANGYALDVDGEGYLFFDQPTLINGFLIHVGLGRAEEVDIEAMDGILKAILDGSAMRQLQEEVNELRAQNEKLTNNLKYYRKGYNKLKNQKFY